MALAAATAARARSWGEAAVLHQNIQSGLIARLYGKVCLYGIRVAKFRQAYAAADSNHGKGLPQGEALSQRILSRPRQARHGFADDGDVRVAVFQVASAQQRDLHGLEEPGIHAIELHAHGTSIHVDSGADRHVAQRRTDRQRYGLYTRKGPKTVLQRVEICLGPGWRVAVPGQSRIDRNDLPVFKARIGGSRMIESPAQKAGDNHQYTTRCDLRADQHLPREDRAMMLAANLQRWRQSEQDRRRESGGEGEDNHAPIRRRIEPCRTLGNYQQASQDDIANRQTRNGSQHRQQKAFGEQLPDQTAVTGPDGDTNRNFALPRHASRQQHAAQIAARHGENQQGKGSHQSENRVDRIALFRSRTATIPDQAGSGIRARLAGKTLVFPDGGGMLPCATQRPATAILPRPPWDSGLAPSVPTSARRGFPRRSP